MALVEVGVVEAGDTAVVVVEEEEVTVTTVMAVVVGGEGVAEGVEVEEVEDVTVVVINPILRPLVVTGPVLTPGKFMYMYY